MKCKSMSHSIIWVRKLIFYGALLFVLIALCSLAGKQNPTYAVSYNDEAGNFYDLIVCGIPVAILLTLFYTVRREHSFFKNMVTICATVLVTFFSIVMLVEFLFSIGIAVWKGDPWVFRSAGTGTAGILFGGWIPLM